MNRGNPDQVFNVDEEGHQTLPDEDQDYDPYLYREVTKPTTNFDTFVHCIKGSVGAGILAMPHAFKYSGTVTGVVGTIGLSLILTYAIIVLVRNQYIICKIKKTPYIPYPYIMRKAFKLGPKIFQLMAPLAPFFVDFFLIAFQLGICCSYLAFISTTLKEILEPNVFNEMDYRWYLLMILVPVLMINYIRTLKRLTPISLTADLLILLSLSMIFYYILGTGSFKFNDTTFFGTVNYYPLFFGTVMFSLEAVGVVLACERNMGTPKDFPKVFWAAMSVVISIYTFVGFMGYTKYGSEIQGSITNSIPKGTALSVIVKAIVAFCIYCSYPLQCYVSLEIIWLNYMKKRILNKEKQLIAEYIMRTVVTLITFVIVLGVSKFELIVSFVGAFCLSTLGLIFPFAIELCILWQERNYGRYNVVLIKDICGIILGIILLFTGTYVAIVH